MIHKANFHSMRDYCGATSLLADPEGSIRKNLLLLLFAALKIRIYSVSIIVRLTAFAKHAFPSENPELLSIESIFLNFFYFGWARRD
jgi:hypothetical protein